MSIKGFTFNIQFRFAFYIYIPKIVLGVLGCIYCCDIINYKLYIAQAKFS